MRACLQSWVVKRRPVEGVGCGVFFATERRLFCDAHFCALPTHYLRTTSALFAHFLHFIECSRMQAAS